MTFTDPDSLPERLLWLRADRGVSGGGAAHFDGVSHARLEGPSGGGLAVGDSDFGFACWVRVNARPPQASLGRADTHIAGKWTSGTNAAREWLLCLNSPTGADQFCFVARGPSPGSTALGPRTAFPDGVEPGKWYFVVCWRDTAARTLNLSVDGATLRPVRYAGTPGGGSLSFTIGASHNMTGFPPISVSRATFFKDPPGGIGARIGDLIASLYRGGAGANIEDLEADQPRSWGMLAYWPLDERSGVRRNLYASNRDRDLRDPTGIGAAAGPFAAPPGHNKYVARWSDPASGAGFTSDGASWRSDGARVVSLDRSHRLDHDGLFLSSRPSWTATIASATSFTLGSGLYGESSGTGDDDYLELRFDHDGVPELAIKAPGRPEVVARASDALAGRRSATAVSAEPVDPGPQPADDVPRARCRVEVGRGHPFASTDMLWVRGLGPPFDGLHQVTHATETEIHYVVDRPTSPPGTAGARRFSGGHPDVNPGPEGLARDTLDHRFPGAWIGSEWTIAGWVRKAGEPPADRAVDGGIFAAKDCSDLRAFGSRPQVVHDGSGASSRYRLDLPGGPSAAFGPAPLGTWVHLAAVRSGDRITLYYDGEPVSSLDVGSDPGLGSAFTGLSFGADATVVGGLACLLDNWGVWLGRSLSEGQVAALHGGGSGPSFGQLPEDLKEDLAAWYDFDEVSGTGIDASGRGRHLTERGLVPAAEGIAGGIPFVDAASGGLVVGSGHVDISEAFPTEAGRALEHRRLVLTVRRDGEEVSFFRNGDPIGTSAIPIDRLGPASGRARALGTSDRLGGARGSLEHLHLVGDALGDDRVVGLAARFSVRANRTRGVGPLSVIFDATQFARVDRMAAQDYHYLWTFTRAGDVLPHDDWADSWNGHSYSRPSGYFVSQVFDEEGEYDAHLAVLTPAYDRGGNPREQSCLFAGKVATIRVDPWPETTATYYVSSTHPNRSDDGPGTSPDAPLATISRAFRRIHRPFTKILCRAGEDFPSGPFLELNETVGPLFVGTYGGPGGEPANVIPSTREESRSGRIIRLSGCTDVRLTGLSMRGTGDMDEGSPTLAKAAYRWEGRNRLLLFRDLRVEDTHRFLSLEGTDRSNVIDRCDLASLGDYTIFCRAACELSVTRCRFEGNPRYHFVRFQHSLRTHIAFCDRDSNYPSGPGRSWVTIRHQARYFNVTDTFGDLLHTTIQGNWVDFLGPHWGMVERNRLRAVSMEASQITVRDNTMGVTSGPQRLSWRDIPRNPRGGDSEGNRAYRNQRLPGSTMRSDRPLIVSEENWILDEPASPKPPEIGLATSGPGSAILASSAGASAASEFWGYCWMRRPSGVDAPFEPLAGQKGTSLYDLPPGPGPYEYRLDMVTASGVEVPGEVVVTVEVSAERDGAGYRLEAPYPPSGLVGEASSPFGVSLLEGGSPPEGPVTITPAADGPGHFDPPRVVLSAGEPSGRFRFTPEASPAMPEGIGARQISTTNDAGLVDPHPRIYVATVPIGDPDDPPPVGPGSPGDGTAGSSAP